ncbi:MAG: 50S ribosomal protein L21 [Defluviitaleaceae bacterium]|nr:50S ribosomal protein L21 [Defluviitaleaceae bacterium]
MYAIIETGGKQYKVKEGDEITVELLGAEAGSKYTFDRVLGVFDENTATFGTPHVSGATVTAEVLGDGKAKKVIVYKYKAKKGFHKKKGHRQPFTRIKIVSVAG